MYEDDSPISMYRTGQPPVAPRRRHRRYALLAGVAVAVLAGAAAVAGILVARNDVGTAVAAPSASASPLGEQETCLRLVPLLSDVAREVTAVIKQPDRDTADLAATAALLRRVEAAAPPVWRPDIAVQYGVLQQLIDARGDHGRIAAVDSTAYYEAVLRLTGGCKPYAT